MGKFLNFAKTRACNFFSVYSESTFAYISAFCFNKGAILSGSLQMTSLGEALDTVSRLSSSSLA